MIILNDLITHKRSFKISSSLCLTAHLSPAHRMLNLGIVIFLLIFFHFFTENKQTSTLWMRQIRGIHDIGRGCRAIWIYDGCYFKGESEQNSRTTSKSWNSVTAFLRIRGRKRKRELLSVIRNKHLEVICQCQKRTIETKLSLAEKKKDTNIYGWIDLLVFQQSYYGEVADTSFVDCIIRLWMSQTVTV